MKAPKWNLALFKGRKNGISNKISNFIIEIHLKFNFLGWRSGDLIPMEAIMVVIKGYGGHGFAVRQNQDIAMQPATAIQGAS